jgi:DDE superfamily endonuclease
LFAQLKLPVTGEAVRLGGHADAIFPLARLDMFRSELHACFTRRADALLELSDALLCAQAVPSLPHLSLEPVHQRGWGSTYAALARGRIDAERLRELLVGCLPNVDQPVFAVDVATWPRCDAECSPERGYYYHPSRHSAGQPIIAGWAFQWIAQVSFDRDSWTAPVDARRLHPLDDTDQTAASQIRVLLARLPAGGPVPLLVVDGGYDSAQLTLDLAEAPAAVLVRLRSDRCFDADPPPTTRSPKGGRPRRHGAKFNFADPATWPTPTATLTCKDDQYGHVTVQAWSGLHPKQQRHPGHGSRGPRPIVRGTIIRVQVERVPAKTRPPKVLWLWWAGPGELDLDLVWRAYIRRFDLEHTIRFCKQTLGWTTPRPRHPAQPTGGPGWSWPPTPSCAWPARSPATSGCRGSGPDPSRDCHPTEYGAGFRACCAPSGRRPPRQNPPGAPQDDPRAEPPGLPRATRRSRSQPKSAASSRPGPRRPPERPSPPSTTADLGRRPAQRARRVKSQAKLRF